MTKIKALMRGDVFNPEATKKLLRQKVKLKCPTCGCELTTGLDSGDISADYCMKCEKWVPDREATR